VIVSPALRWRLAFCLWVILAAAVQYPLSYRASVGMLIPAVSFDRPRSRCFPALLERLRQPTTHQRLRILPILFVVYKWPSLVRLWGPGELRLRRPVPSR